MGLTGTSVAEGGVAASPPSCAPATFYVAQGGNDIFWRSLAPAKAIGATVCVIPEQTIDEEVLHMDGEAFKWEIVHDPEKPDDWYGRYPDHEGAAVWVRPDLPRAFHAEQMREQGNLTVSEVDDNYLANPRLNIFQRMAGFDEQGQRDHLFAMASTDRIVFSTEWLRDYYLKAMRKRLGRSRSTLPEAFVCRNNIDEADWPTPIPRENKLRVGWMGSPSHIWDVNLAYAALYYASRNGCEVHMIGYDPSNPQYGQSAGALSSEKALRAMANWKEIGYEFTPWVKPEDYHRTALPLDIGLAPLLHNENTDGKSDVKFIEYTISGAATIAWNTPVYHTIVHGETGLLVSSHIEAMKAVDLLIRKPSLRERLVANAREYVRRERGLAQLKDEWGAAVSPS